MKHIAESLSAERQRSRPLGRGTTPLLLAIVVVGSVLHLGVTSRVRQEAVTPIGEHESDHPFSWSNIVPSEKLQYHDCHKGLQCARLSVPLAYDDAGEGSNVALAVIRRPARVPITSPHYGGAIITNPGGPGGSGVAQQLSMGHYIQMIVDAQPDPSIAKAESKYFDIISFDPRGVNHTTPTISCFPDSAARERWDLQTTAEGLLGSSSGSLRSKWRRARAVADGCSRRLGKFGEHVNTTPVARDVITIIDKHGEWLRSHQQTLRAASKPSCHPEHYVQKPQNTTEEPLRFWGFSYGSLLGSTIASMYPGRIERMVLDGVVDSDDYYSGSWTKNLDDTDAIFHKFASYCFEAGPRRCPFWRHGGAAAIENAYEHLLEAIRDDPLSVPGTADRGPELITWSDIRLLVAPSLYQPLQLFPALAELLQDLTEGNGTLFAEYKMRNQAQLCNKTPALPEELCEKPFSHGCVLPGWSPYDASSAVLCTDAAPEEVQFDEAEFSSYWETLRNQSHTMGDFWAQTRLSCAGWLAKAKWRFQGPIGGKTKHPVLFIGNSLDPVTPLSNARHMSSKFKGASLLQQDSEGHCSFTEPSVCTTNIVRHYFQTGELPESGKVCQPDRRPFLAGGDDEARGEEVRAMLEHASAAFHDLKSWPLLPL
jgi:pimeloyl-ACP methyl ester carboxylesterase